MRCPSTPFRTLLLAGLLVAPGLSPHAQSGDRAGEIQTPPPPHLRSPPAPALSAKDALRTFALPPGFRMELVAAEPLVFDPVAMSIGADGRLWVVEMRGYMNDVTAKNEGEPIGSIALLDDTNGDGRMDRRSDFVGGLVLPRALAVVADGLLVAEPPNLWFFRDTDGDGRADERTLVADGYGDRSNPEHTANGLMWAMDNWIYSANHRVRYRYDRGLWRREPTAFRGQWGITQDDAGRLFYNTNSDPLRMDVLPAEYLRRNPHLVAPAGVNLQLARASDVPLWPGRITLGVNRGYRMLRDDGTLPLVTAACGPMIYRGSAFPSEFRGNAFFAEPAANLVKRLIVDTLAEAPSARNAYERAEFLTSTDERFRPVNLYNGPDGALYVVDMYRGVIQHRIYLTTYLRRQIEQRGLEAPVGLGRIWRIVPEGAKPHVKPNLARMSNARLVRALEHPDGWWRDTAQRLLVERGDVSVAALLRRSVREAPSSLARLHALWTLEGLSAADWETVARALRDPDVQVAAAAARLAESLLAARNGDAVIAALEGRARAGEPVFLRQMALSLGAGEPAQVDPLLLQLATKHGGLLFLDDAIVSSWVGREPEMLERLEQRGDPGARRVAASLSATILNSNDAANVAALFERLRRATTPAWLVDAVLDGVDRFVPGQGDRRRTVFLPAEPRSLIEFSQRASPPAARARDALRFLRWKGRPGAADSSLASLDAAQREQYERGRRQYAVCAACHQPNGEGMNGLAPPLVGSPWATGSVAALTRIVLNGKSSGETTMPPLASLDDQAIADILTYVRRSWGHESSVVGVGEVQAIRTEVENRQEPWTEADLEPMR